MDQTTSVLAALEAGKLPNQKQINQAIEWVLSNAIPKVEPSGGGELSEEGKIIANDLREVLQSYKHLGCTKNRDNIIQNALWHLSEGDLQNLSANAVSTDEVSADLNAIRSALRTVLKVAWTNVSSEGSALFEDFASFARLALADFAEIVETQASKAKDGLRTLDAQVQHGERDQLGKTKKSEEEAQQDGDPKVRWQNGMDIAKDAGTAVIGLGQDVKASAEETAERTTTRLQAAYINMCDRAQKDQQYHDAMVTLFDTTSKWLNKSVDTASSMDESTSLSDFIKDPTREQHVHKAIHLIRTFIERLAEGKSLDDLLARVRECAVDVRADKDLKAWFDDFFKHVRKSLDQAGYARSDEAAQTYKDLRRRWKALSSDDSDEGRKWKADADALKKDIYAVEVALASDEELNKVKKAHVRLGEHLEEGAAKAGKVGLQLAVDQAMWLWQDLFNVYAPRLMGLLKDIPIPRTEYVDKEVEFVLENLDISSFSLLPGHVYIRNITDVDITASSSAPTTTATGTLTHIKIQAMQLSLKDVSFYYKDKTATLGPAEFTGLMEFKLPAKGVDVDVKARLLPNTPQGLKHRERRGGYHFIERVEVSVAEDVELAVKDSNHPVLLTMFKPIFALRFREALAKTLAEQIRALLETADSLAWDVGKRSEVFGDAGLGTGAALAAAVWSEIGRLQKREGGLLSGWKTTGTGFVKDDLGNEGKLAMGAEPQILSGEKKGPLGTNSESLKERLLDVGIDTSSARNAANGAAQKTMDLAREGERQVKSFKGTVESKAREERKKPGWQSEAFTFN